MKRICVLKFLTVCEVSVEKPSLVGGFFCFPCRSVSMWAGEREKIGKNRAANAIFC